MSKDIKRIQINMSYYKRQKGNKPKTSTERAREYRARKKALLQAGNMRALTEDSGTLTTALQELSHLFTVNYLEEIPKSQKETCRTCLGTNKSMKSFDEPIIPSSRVTIVEYLKESKFIEISDYDNISKKICIVCFKKLRASYKFKLQCINSEEYWEEELVNDQNSKLQRLTQLEPKIKSKWVVSKVKLTQKSGQSKLPQLPPVKPNQPERESTVAIEDTLFVDPSKLIPEPEIKVEPEFVNIAEMEVEDFNIKKENEDIREIQKKEQIDEVKIKKEIFDEPSENPLNSIVADRSIFTCPLCKMKFYHERHILRHMEIVHPNISNTRIVKCKPKLKTSSIDNVKIKTFMTRIKQIKIKNHTYNFG